MKALSILFPRPFTVLLGAWAFALVAAALILTGGNAQACERPAQDAGYLVTDDNATALELGIDYRENTDYEADATERLNAAGTDTVCEHLSRFASDGYLLSWYECEGELPAE